MADNDVRKIQQAFDEVKAGLSSLRTELQQLTESIDSNHYVPAQAITMLSIALEKYKIQAEKLENVGAELSIPIGNDITDISNAIQAFEDKRHNSQLRKLVLDYFKLTAERARVNNWLEDSKRKLMEKCATCGNSIANDLVPYTLAVEYLRSSDSELSDEKYQIIEDGLGASLATEVEGHGIRYDENHDLTQYLDASCEFLMPSEIHSNPEGNNDGAGTTSVEDEHPEIVDAIDSPAEAIDTVDYTTNVTDEEVHAVEPTDEYPEDIVEGTVTETEITAKKYSGLISDATFEYADNRPASELRASEFKSVVQQKHDIPYILKWLAEEKLYTLGQVGNSGKNYNCPAYAGSMEYLVKHGYITKITIRSGMVSGEYYTLSDKGWACYTKHDVAQFLKNEYNKPEKVNHAKLSVPLPVQMSSKEMDGVKAVQIALLHEYLVRAQSNSIVFNLPTFAFAITLAEKPVGIISTIFTANEDVDSAIKGIADFIKNTGDERQFVLIVADKSDMDAVRAIFAQCDDLPDALTYCVVSDNYQLFDTNGIIAQETTELIAAVEASTVEPANEKSDSAFVAALKRVDSTTQRVDMLGDLSTEIGNGEDKKISSSIFMSDIRKGNETASKIAIKDLIDIGIISIGFLVSVHKMPEAIASSCLEYLYRKGYLRHYILGNIGDFYVTSPKLEKALQFVDASKYIGVRRLSDSGTGCWIADDSKSAAVRIALHVIEKDARLRFHEKKVLETTISRNTTEFTCSALIKKRKDSSDAEALLCAVWNDAHECEPLFETAELMMGKADTIARITFAALTVEKAKALAAAYLEVSSFASRCDDVFVYSILDKSYENYREDVKTENDEIRDAETTSDESVEETENDTTTVEIKEVSDDNISSETEEHIEETESYAKSNNDSETDESIILNNVYKMLQDDRFYAATSYLKAKASAITSLERVYSLLAYALNDPMAHCIYQTDTVYPMVSENTAFDESLVISIALRTFYSNQNSYDFGLKSFYASVKESPLLTRFPSLSKVVYSLMSFKDKYKKGMDAYAAYREKGKTELEAELDAIRYEAATYYGNFIVGRIKENAQQKRFLETKKMLFDVNGEIGTYIKVVSDNDCDYLPFVEEFLRKNFYKDSSLISSDTIDSDMLWHYIVTFWDKAAETLTIRKQEKLMSSLRSNITNCTTKAIQIIARWYVLVAQMGSTTEDSGSEAYKKVCKPMLDMLKDALYEVNADMNHLSLLLEECSSMHVLHNTLREIISCVSGDYNEKSHKYYYAPFLMTDDVMLQDDFIPDFDMHTSTLNKLMPDERILMHVRKFSNAQYTFESRLQEIMEEQGDDFGAAKLIMEYLTDMQIPSDVHYSTDNINTSISYAEGTASLRKDDFIGELELAQSYGQIDNSEINRTESILSAVDNWFEWAKETNNFGFFKKVLDAYLEDIRESSKPRENDLLKRLEKFKETPVSGLSADVKKTRVERIANTIREQKYTVAEDLLGRAISIEDEVVTDNDEDFLQKFLDDYADYYKDISSNTAFETLVNRNARNKEQRGGQKLAQSWFPNSGSPLTSQRLTSWLACFGFKGTNVVRDNVDKHESYIVKPDPLVKASVQHYTHPIAAFGSGFQRDGFRVICLPGRYDADQLIAIMEKVGNARHTLILVDWALQLTERRRLARKAKMVLEDKMFGVIDRTVMMYMVKHYDETKNARMLMSLIAPFTYYQPYVWESANVMPPEIFMGRKTELEKIKSATGVNIVYGGRQLGKSALLKHAMEDINMDENGDRAVYIEIKGLDYYESARKIGHELYDQDILLEDIDTTDWDELARAVKRRLRMAGAGQIPYFLLLLDEADAFIESSEAVNYKPFDALKDIQSIGAGRFKFVVAGLRNVVRFKRNAALGNNSVITHLRDMTVKPFNPSEARELLETPLRYLGLRFPKDKESLITLILASTNYFPGLIQMYCAKLLEAMRNKDYAGYDEVDSPVYEVSVDHIKKVLADPEFTKQIWDKYYITLKLDEDDYYYIIALVMAYLYRDKGSSVGYTIDEILKACKEMYIRRITMLDGKLDAFMEEMVELNVLRKSDDTHYLFTRYTFYQMMVARIDIEDELFKYMEE